MTNRDATLPWLTVARKYIGVRETPGKETAPTLARWLRQLGAWWTDDETPWCGTFVGACLDEAGMGRPKHWYRAKAYLDWGTFVPAPAYGSIVVYDRAGGGHVGFVVGTTPSGKIVTLGGNQGNAVSLAPFEPTRVLGFRWPLTKDGMTDPYFLTPPPVLASNAPLSQNEA